MNEVKNYLMYVVCVSLLFLFLFTSVKLFEKKSNLLNSKLYAMVNSYETKKIIDKDKNVNITYPVFSYSKLDSEIEKFIKQFDDKDNIRIECSINVNKNIINMFYLINENSEFRYKNINYNILEESFIENGDVFDFNLLGSEVLEKVKLKYSSYIYEKVYENNFKNTYVKISNEGIYIYFDNSIFDDIIYKVFVLFEDENYIIVSDVSYDKAIAFTFDDGPSQYTKSLVDTLVLNDSKATFFELGNRMKYNQDEVLYAYNNGMEIGSHTYAHKNLNKLNDEEIDEEINSTNIIFNEITGDDIKYLRPPYGNANSSVKERVNMPIITWNVDTNDWLSRDSEAIYNHILEHVEDGDIILMHDIYPETIEAVKMVLPVLKEMGYKVTSVSELASIKDKTLENGVIYRSFK